MASSSSQGSSSDTVAVESKAVKSCKFASLCRFSHGFSKWKSPTADNLLFWYSPGIGAASYTAFSLHIFNPHLLESLFPRAKYTVANCLLFNAHLGSGLYLFGAKHLSKTNNYYRIMYSIYGALIFNFGSVLLWAVTKSILPEDGIVRTVFSLSSSICLLLIGKEYVNYVDGLCNASP